jgi:hypothetical protein
MLYNRGRQSLERQLRIAWHWSYRCMTASTAVNAPARPGPLHLEQLGDFGGARARKLALPNIGDRLASSVVLRFRPIGGKTMLHWFESRSWKSLGTDPFEVRGPFKSHEAAIMTRRLTMHHSDVGPLVMARTSEQARTISQMECSRRCNPVLKK